MPEYSKNFQVGWVDVDANSHMRNTSYVERVADVRLMYFVSYGYSVSDFHIQNFGPVVRKDEIEYFRELNLLETFSVNFEVAGLSDDASRMYLSHTFLNQDKQLSATVRTMAGWLDLAERKLIAPPEVLRNALWALDKTDDFKPLPSSVKK